jgi:hypothetical protein
MKYFILPILVSIAINLNAQRITKKESNIFDYEINKVDTCLVMKKLKGLWRSDDDKEYTVKFNGNKYYEYYSHKCVTKSKYTIVITKAHDVKNTIKVRLIVFDADRNFEIVSLSNKILTIIDDESGNIIPFKKLE